MWTWAEVAEQPVEIESVSIKSCITAGTYYIHLVDGLEVFRVLTNVRSLVNESNVELWGCDPSRNQKWKVNLDGTIGLVSDPSLFLAPS